MMNHPVTPAVYLFILIGSVLIALWSVYADPVINVDGILYIQAAQAMATGDFATAHTLYKWPFYSYLIFFLSKVTGLELITAAHVLNTFFNIGACIAFVLIIGEMGGTRRTILISALVIVLFPGLNELRSFVIRDHAYIAFFLFSFLFLIRALHYRRLGVLMSSMVLMGCATLFRIEGTVFLAAIPFIYVYCGDHSKSVKRLSMIVMCLVLLVFLVPILGWWLRSSEEAPSLFALSNIGNGWEQISLNLDAKIELLKRKFLDTASSSTARLIYVWTVLGVILTQIVVMLTAPYAFIAGYGLKRRMAFPRPAIRRAWKLFLYFNILILLLFTFVLFILTDRYPLALAILLLMVVPFALEEIYKRWQRPVERSRLAKLGYGLLALVLIANCIEGFVSLSNKHYLQQAGAWLQSRMSANDRLYTNSPIIGFYSGGALHKVTVVDNVDKFLADFYRGEWNNHEYLAVQVSPNPKFEKHLKKTLWVKPEKVFTNSRGDQVRLYDIATFRKREHERNLRKLRK